MDQVLDIVTALGGLGWIAAIVLAIVAWRKANPEMRKTDADADKTAAEAWAILVENLQGRVTALENEQAMKEQRIQELEDEVDDLRGYMEKNGLKPPPRKRRG